MICIVLPFILATMTAMMMRMMTTAAQHAITMMTHKGRALGSSATCNNTHAEMMPSNSSSQSIQWV